MTAEGIALLEQLQTLDEEVRDLNARLREVNNLRSRIMNRNYLPHRESNRNGCARGQVEEGRDAHHERFRDLPTHVRCAAAGWITARTVGASV